MGHGAAVTQRTHLFPSSAHTMSGQGNTLPSHYKLSKCEWTSSNKIDNSPGLLTDKLPGGGEGSYR